MYLQQSPAALTVLSRVACSDIRLRLPRSCLRPARHSLAFETYKAVNELLSPSGHIATLAIINKKCCHVV